MSANGSCWLFVPPLWVPCCPRARRKRIDTTERRQWTSSGERGTHGTLPVGSIQIRDVRLYHGTIAVAKAELIDSPDRGLWPEPQAGVDGYFRALSKTTDNPTYGRHSGAGSIEMADDDGRRCTECSPSQPAGIIWMYVSPDEYIPVMHVAERRHRQECGEYRRSRVYLEGSPFENAKWLSTKRPAEFGELEN